MSEPLGGSAGEGGTDNELETAESDVIDEMEGRALRNADLSLKRMVLRRKLEAPLDLRPAEAAERGSNLGLSTVSSSGSRP